MNTPATSRQTSNAQPRSLHEVLCRWYWMTTAPNPKSPATGFDAGQRGWKRHAVWAKESATMKDVRFTQSLCGITPAHGWGDDLFIEAKCERCERLMAKRHNDKLSEVADSAAPTARQPRNNHE